MDFWAESQGHLPQYSKYNTLPSRSCSQNYHDRRPPPQYQVYCDDQRSKTIDSGYYWPPRDTPNWSNQEPTAPTSPVQFPFNLDHQIQHYHGDQRQELQDWTTYQHQERGFQHEGWSYNPAHYKREISKKNDNNFRELEAWALRYSHSLPRRRRIEAGLRGAMQDNIERRDIQMTNVQESTLRDRVSRQQAINCYQTMPQRQNFEVKDKLSYQTKMYSQPPNYNAPPPYTVQYRNVLTPQKLANQSFELPQTVNKTEKELNDKNPAKVLDILQENRQLVQRKPSSNAAKVIEGRKFQLNKKAGGMTIFCLVSRIADTEPETLPVSQKQNEVEHPKVSNVSQPLKLADEVDFKIQTSTTKHARSSYSKLQAIPICKESLSKMADKNTQKSNEVSVIGKLAAKFPLWRRPSFTCCSGSENASKTTSKENLDSILQENQEKDSQSGGKTDIESQKVDSKDGDATLMTDTTRVVVKMDLLKAPNKQQVQYLSSENQTQNGQNVAKDAAECNQDIQTKQQDTKPAEDLKTEAEPAKSKDVVERTESGNILPIISETLEERANRIYGLPETPTAQQEDHFDFGVESLTKQSYDTNGLEGKSSDQKDLVNVSSIGKSEQLQPLQVSDNKEEEIERSTEIGEVGKSEENIKKHNDFETDDEVQEFKMAERFEKEAVVEIISGQCKETTEMSDLIDISNTLEVSEQGGNKDALQTSNENSNWELRMQQQLESIASKPTESQVDEDTEDLSKHDKDGPQPILTAEKVEILSEDILDLQDQDQNITKVSEVSSDLVENVAKGQLGELKLPDNIDHEEDLEDFSKHEKDGVQPILTTGEVEISSEPILDLQDQNQNVTKVSEVSSDLVENIANGQLGELNWLDDIDYEQDKTSTNELEMQEEVIVQATEIKNLLQFDSGQIEEVPTLEKSQNEQNQCVKPTETLSVELYGSNMAESKSVLKDDSTCFTDGSQNGDEGIEVATIDLEIQEKREELIHEMNESEILTKAKPDVMKQVDILVASDENAKDFEESKNEEQFGCRNKADANEQGCIAKNSIEETVLGADEQVNQDQGTEPATLTDAKVEILSEDVEQNTEEGENVNKVNQSQVLDGEKDECFSVNVDSAISSDLEMQKTTELNDNIEFGEEKSEICRKDKIISVQNLEVDNLEITHEEGVVNDTDRFDLQDKEEKEEELIGETCTKLHSETAAILVEDNEQANETETPKDMDLKVQILDEIGKIDASDCDINDFDLEECEWEDENIMKNGLNAKNNEICQSTKSEEDLQPQVHPSDKDITDPSLVCQPDSNVNTSAAILVRSSTSLDSSEQPLPSTSALDNDNYETPCCEEEGKYPKSLWDAVNRIRKHTAPDSENEEEEVIDNWDRESLVSVESVFQNIVKQGDIDFMQSEQCYDYLNIQDDTFSQCSNSSQESDGTIVDDELEVTEMTNVESIEICNEDQSSDGEGQNESENTMNQSQNEEIPDEGLDKQAEIDEDIML